MVERLFLFQRTPAPHYHSSYTVEWQELKAQWTLISSLHGKTSQNNGRMLEIPELWPSQTKLCTGSCVTAPCVDVLSKDWQRQYKIHFGMRFKLNELWSVCKMSEHEKCVKLQLSSQFSCMLLSSSLGDVCISLHYECIKRTGYKTNTPKPFFWGFHRLLSFWTNSICTVQLIESVHIKDSLWLPVGLSTQEWHKRYRLKQFFDNNMDPYQILSSGCLWCSEK